MRAHFMSKLWKKERKAQEKAKQSASAGTETENVTGTSHIEDLEEFLQERNADNDESKFDI